MTTPPEESMSDVVCARGVCLRTLLIVFVFASSLAAAPGDHHRKARRLVAEAEQTSNPIRLFMLALEIRKELDAALAENANDVEVRLDLLRFHAMTPRLAGGDMEKAREQAAEIARRDAALGHFARGYLAYREKQYGPARVGFREAAKSPARRALALRWLGWLSQETMQWDDAFAAFEELRDQYEIARTASFCSCRLEKGRAAIAAFLKANPRDEKARKVAEKLK